MDEQQPAAPAASRRFRRALRLLVVVGGALVWWLLFSGGSAHADDQGRSPADTAHAALRPAAGAVPHTMTSRLTGALRATPNQVDHVVMGLTKDAPEPVHITVQALTTVAAPTLGASTTAVADTVEHTVATVDDVAATRLPGVTVSAPTVGQPQPAHRTHVRAARQHTLPASTTTDLASRRAATGDIEKVGQPRPGDHQTPVQPGAPAVTGVNGGAPSGPVAALGGFLLASPAIRRRRRGHLRPVRPVGPAYRPGSSPD